MGKRPTVPTALHSELTEYAALIRALRTSDTLDLTSQLTRSATSASGHDLAAEEDLFDEDDDGSQRPPTEGRSHSAACNSSTSTSKPTKKRKRATSTSASSSKGKKRARDTWTRWPLLAGDVHVPEWDLEDEVKLLASQFLKRERASIAPGAGPVDVHSVDNPESEFDVDDDIEDILTSNGLRALTDASATHLSRILALLAAHVPPAEKSMKNRVGPFNWKTVVDVVGASGLVDANILQNVRRRMEAIYGPSPSHVVERVQCTSSVELRLAGMCAPHELSFLTLPGYDPTASMPKRKRGPYRKRKKGQSEEPDVKAAES